MKETITVAIVFLSVCFGVLYLTLPVAISGELEGKILDFPRHCDAVNVFMDRWQMNTSVPEAADLNPPTENETTGTNLVDLYVQAMGDKCVTPHTICDIDPQPINYPCCCDDGTCGYVSQ